MINYLLMWLHAYLVHLGAWITFIIAASVYKEGAPRTLKGIKELVLAALILGSLGAIASSTSHVHYSQYLAKVVEE